MPLVKFQLTPTTVHISAVATFTLLITSLALKSTQAPLSVAEHVPGQRRPSSSLCCAASGSDIPVNEGVHCFAKRYELTSPRYRTGFTQTECDHAPQHTKQGLSTSNRAGKPHGGPQHPMLPKWFSDR
ncbi:hypothetical protein TRVL_07898 [Trypanosoma vivax]|nr:hypothetical protein TRVL_07898 [Trypanosoma vivax]